MTGPFVAENAFDKGFSVFCELPTENARALLPPHLEPMELRHGTAVLSAAVFDFTAGPAGPYGELVLSIHVVPLIEAGRPMPKAALYPFMLGSTTLSACEYAIDVWHFPHWQERLQVEFTEDEKSISAWVGANGETVVELTAAAAAAWSPGAQTYQSFMQDQQSFMAYVTHSGDLIEHEEATGSLRLADHPFHAGLDIAEVSDVPFREIWMRAGTQGFEECQKLD